MKIKITSAHIDIPVRELNDGELAVITAWPYGLYAGNVIQRYGDKLVTIGKPEGKGFTQISTRDDCRVRRLVPGDIITLQPDDNENGF